MRYNGWVYRHPNTPCKECAKRYLGCHDHCEEYQAARAEYENIKNAAHANEELNRYISEQITKTLRRKK